MNAPKSTLRLEQVKDATDREWNRKDTLESKATSLIQVSGTMTAIIFGFVTFAQSTGDISFPLHTQILIGASVILGIVTILICVIVLYLQDYKFPVRQRYYFQVDKGQFLKDDAGKLILDPIRKQNHHTEQSIFEGHLKMLDHNRLKNDQKSALLIWGFVALLISIALIGGAVFTFFMMASPGQKDIDPLECAEVDPGSMRSVHNSQLLDPVEVPGAKLLICIG